MSHFKRVNEITCFLCSVFFGMQATGQQLLAHFRVLIGDKAPLSFGIAPINRCSAFVLYLLIALLPFIFGDRIEAIMAIAVGLIALSPHYTYRGVEKKKGTALLINIKRSVISCCGLLINTLIGALGAEFAGLRAVFSAVLGILQLFFRILSNKKFVL